MNNSKYLINGIITTLIIYLSYAVIRLRRKNYSGGPIQVKNPNRKIEDKYFRQI